MIVLITGASHAGKTSAAQRLLEKYHIPYLSIDHLKMGLIRSGNTDLTVYDTDKLTDYLWPIVAEMIKTAIENNQNLIIEGLYIPFGWEKDFSQDYLDHIQYECIVLSEKYIENHLQKIKDHSNDIERRLADSGLSMEELKKDNAYYLENCKKYGYDYIYVEDKYDVDIEIDI